MGEKRLLALLVSLLAVLGSLCREEDGIADY